MGIKRNDVFPSKYISSADIDGREIELIIQSIEMEDVSDGEQKAVVYFNKGTKGAVLNVTNWNTLEDAYGEDSDAWIGQPVILTVERTTFKGKPTKGLRLKIPAQQGHRQAAARPRPQVPPSQSENPAADMDDEIPF
jgi:hypothetical protein